MFKYSVPENEYNTYNNEIYINTHILNVTNPLIDSRNVKKDNNQENR